MLSNETPAPYPAQDLSDFNETEKAELFSLALTYMKTTHPQPDSALTNAFIKVSALKKEFARWEKEPKDHNNE